MARQRSRSQPRHAASYDDRTGAWVLACVTALMVARPFTPGVAVAPEGHGVLFVVLWLATLLLWWVGRLRRTPTPLRFGIWDGAVVAVFLIYSLTAIIACGQGSPRPALNMMWQWIAMGVNYFLIRQVVRHDHERQILLVVMIGVAVAMAAIAGHQFFVALPNARADYESRQHDTVALYEVTGEWLEPDSPARKRFEDRLYSSEPYATFALANSLGGFVIMWLVILVSVVSSCPSGKARPISLAGGAGLALVLVGCLVLTKSRSAMLAACLGVCVPLVRTARSRLGSKGKLVMGAVLALVIAAAGLWALFHFDQGIVTQAGKSLGYRHQYWQATWNMICDQPWLGCGPGQFQDTYTAYKLPAASEEIADPHNFLLEIWSTAGIGAATAMVIVVGLVMSQSVRQLSADHNLDAGQEEQEPQPVPARWIYTGACGGLVLAPLAAAIAQQPVGLVPWALAAVAFAVTLWIGRRWVVGTTTMLRGAASLGALTLLVHWLAAGGLSDPAVATSLWFLVALALPQPRVPKTARQRPQRPPRWSLAASGIGLAVTCILLAAAYWTEYRPVLKCRELLNDAEAPQIRTRLPVRLKTLQAACRADRWSIASHRRLSALAFAAWRGQPEDAEQASLWQAAGERALQLAPRSSRVFRESSQRYHEAYKLRRDPASLRRATRDARLAVECYPTEAECRLHLAQLLLEGGQRVLASEELDRCLTLDDAKRRAGHADKVLPVSQRLIAEELRRDAAKESSIPGDQAAVEPN